ncbi:hypothetical protein [Psychromicrobium xiongbiense]|uniref:hypothetical protein n=1 Tax=Psychromicrobium xiongbiense TaxID=3051184 RepID=UPI00255340CA|nr:hypothetical protein [Psychromicrobium sp. YIM S02556]
MTVAIIVALFGCAFLWFGLAVFNGAESGRNAAKELQAAGLSGVVTDARVKIWTNTDGNTTVSDMELTFTGADGSSHTLSTKHFPRTSVGNSDPAGWYSDFSTKAQVVGQKVTYRLGDQPAVELENQLPGLINAPWGFANYLGLVFGGLGVIVLIGAAVTFIRSLSAG